MKALNQIPTHLDQRNFTAFLPETSPICIFNWGVIHTQHYISFRRTAWWFYICTCCKVITAITLVGVHHHPLKEFFFLVVRTLLRLTVLSHVVQHYELWPACWALQPHHLLSECSASFLEFCLYCYHQRVVVQLVTIFWTALCWRNLPTGVQVSRLQ